MTDATPAFESAGDDVLWSIQVLDAVSGAALWSERPDLVLKTASVGKLFLLIEVARRIDAGDLGLDELIERSEEHSVADSGLWQALAADELSVGDACCLIGAVSDNLATNVLLDRVGLATVTARTRELGFRDSVLLDRVRDERMPQHPPTLSLGTAAELASVMSRLHRGDIGSPAVSRRVLDWLGLNTDLSMVASAFGLDPLAHTGEDRGVLLRNKTGTTSFARVDVGIVSCAGRSLAWAALANWDAGVLDARRAVLERMAAIGERLRVEIGAP